MNSPEKDIVTNITDSIIEIKYQTVFPFELLIGLFFDALDDTYNYQPVSVEKPEGIEIGLNRSIFSNDKIRFEIHPNKIVFNFNVGQYTDWWAYKAEVLKVLNQLSTINCFDSFSGLSLRYIRQYPNTNLSTIIQFTPPAYITKSEVARYNFKSEFTLGQLNVISNYTNNLPVMFTDSEPGFMTVININVVNPELDLKDVESLSEALESVNNANSSFFYDLLN